MAHLRALLSRWGIRLLSLALSAGVLLYIVARIPPGEWSAFSLVDGGALATAVLIAHIAANTETIRLGAGGIMLPNHAPLVIAEQFGTLAILHPGRIDLGLGRAPGSDQASIRSWIGRGHQQAV